jgi:hypothetical protein
MPRGIGAQKRLYDDWGYLRQVQDALGRGGEVLQRKRLRLGGAGCATRGVRR